MREIISQIRQKKAAARLAQNEEVERIIIGCTKEQSELLITNGLIEEIKKIGKIKQVELKETDKIEVSLQ